MARPLFPEPQAESPFRHREHPILAGVLFTATFASMSYAGAGMANPEHLYPGMPVGEVLAAGLGFSLPLALIMLAHEMGHYAASRFHGVRASYPYFLPFPPSPAGTLGAFIAVRERLREKRVLFDVGAAGPLAGLAVALPVLVWGIMDSPVTVFGLPPPGTFLIMEGDSILYWALKTAIHGPLPPGTDIHTSQMAMAGWYGLLLTAFNLVPVGQLDGGHVTYALLGARHRAVARIFHAGLFAMGITGILASILESGAGLQMGRAVFLSGWIVLAALLRLFGTQHPRVDDETARLSPGRVVCGWFTMACFIATFTPIPLTIVEGGGG